MDVHYFPTPVICIISAPPGSFEGIVTAANLVFAEAGTKDLKGAALPGLIVCPEQRSLPATSLNCPKSVPITMFSFYDTDRSLYRALIRDTIFEPESDNPHITKQLNEYFDYLARMIEHEKEAGNVRKDVDPYTAVLCIGALYIGTLIRFFRDPEITPR